MSDQVIRYENERTYLDYSNRRETLCRGKSIGLPDWGRDPDAYWDAYYHYKQAHPGCHIRMCTWLLCEQIEAGKLIRQRTEYENVVFDSDDDLRVGQAYVKKHMPTDPGVAVSTEFKTLQEAENMRHLLLQGEPGYYYALKHRTRVAIIRENTNDM